MQKLSSAAAARLRPSSQLRVSWLLLLSLLWILFVSSTRAHEMVVGIVSVAAAAAFLELVYRSENLRMAFRIRDVLEGWRVPGDLVSGSWTILLVLIKDLVSIQRAGSFYCVCGFQTAKEKPEMVSRRVLATAYTTVAPNSIVLGIDYTQSRMLFHQMQRSPLSRMTLALGAKSRLRP